MNARLLAASAALASAACTSPTAPGPGTPPGPTVYIAHAGGGTHNVAWHPPGEYSYEMTDRSSGAPAPTDRRFLPNPTTQAIYRLQPGHRYEFTIRAPTGGETRCVFAAPVTGLLCESETRQ